MFFISNIEFKITDRSIPRYKRFRPNPRSWEKKKKKTFGFRYTIIGENTQLHIVRREERVRWFIIYILTGTINTIHNISARKHN